jgi:hypothetical protein
VAGSGSVTDPLEVVMAKVVVADPVTPDCDDARVPVSAELADRFGLREPRAGGMPVGYAIVDDDGMIRCRTLDAELTSLLGEVGTILGALA